jgi:hypothetical protein
MNETTLPVYEVYRGIPLFVYEDIEDSTSVGVQFDWYGRLQEAQEEEYEQPTLVNKLNAAHGAIDLLLAIKEQGMVNEQGYLKSVDTP